MAGLSAQTVNTFINHGSIKLIKSDSKDITCHKRFIIRINANLLNFKKTKNPEKKYHTSKNI